MKLLLDENLPHALRHELPGHDVFTVHYLGWSGVRNGTLLANAAADGFDAMITMDNGVAYQQNLSALPLSVIVLSAPSNDIDDLRSLLERLRIALADLSSSQPRTVMRIH